MTCPYCKSEKQPWKRGFYLRHSDGKRLQRFQCRDCKKSYSEQRFSIEFRLRKRHGLQALFRYLCRGMSQRAAAEEFQIHRDSVARRIQRFGACAKNNLAVYRQGRDKVAIVQMDELITFEHTKCKPVTVPIAVEEGTRKILSLSVGRIAAFGHLAAISRKKYGRRPCERNRSLRQLFEDLKSCAKEDCLIKSDESKHYPPQIQRAFPKARHEPTKGQRGCVVGQGELKKCGFDPIFSLNHSYAMFRDNLKRLARRTWATTKKIPYLEHMLYMYAWLHNLRLDRKKSKKPVEITWLQLST